MKKTFLTITIFTFLAGVITSCKKDVNGDIIDPGNNNNMKALTISESFNWSTNKTIAVEIEGIPGAIQISRTLTLSNDGVVFFSMLLPINQNLSTTLVVPQTLNSLTLQYGSFEQVFDLTGGKIEYSFLPVVEE